MKVRVGDTSVGLMANVRRNGDAQTGETVIVAISDPDTTNSFLDFNDNTFKTAGWTTKTLTLTEDSSETGVYKTVWDSSSAITVERRVVAIFEIASGSNKGQVMDPIWFTDEPTAANVQTIDDNVDAVLVDTDTTIPALIQNAEDNIRGTNSDTLDTLSSQMDSLSSDAATIDSNVDAILVDTDTTIPNLIQAAEDNIRGTNSDTLDTLSGQIDTLSTDVATMDSNVDAILVDTDTTIPALIQTAEDNIRGTNSDTLDTLSGQMDTLSSDVATMDSNVDAILVDTGTTLPAQITSIETSINANVDAAETAILAAIAALVIPSAGSIADAVWDELLAGHAIVGSTGEALSAILTDTATTIPGLISALDAKIDIIDGIVDAVLVDTGTTIPALISASETALTAEIDANEAKIDIIDGIVDAILVDTDTTIPALIAALSIPTTSAIADAVWDELMSGHETAGTAGLFMRKLLSHAIAKAVYNESTSRLTVSRWDDENTTENEYDMKQEDGTAAGSEPHFEKHPV